MSYSLPRVAFWLVPRLKERQLLKREIVLLAKRFSSPLFLPHATLFSCHRSEAQQELSLLASLSRRLRPVTLTVASLAASDVLTRAFYLDLEQNNETEQLSQLLSAGCPQVSGYTFDLHVSLMYQDLTTVERDRLLKSWRSPISEICFDQLWAVAIPAQINKQEGCGGWQPLLVCQLDSFSNGVTL